MEIIRATPVGASGEAALDAEWLLTSPGDGSGLRYQQLFMLQLPTGGLAEELLVGEGTSLRVRAHHLILNALDSSAAERAEVAQADSTGLRVTLPIPRIIHSIRFANAHSPGGKTTELYRTDGDTVAEEPVASCVNAVSIGHVVKSDGGPAEAPVEAKSSSVAPQAESDAQPLASGGSQHALPAGELGVTDGRILVRLLGTTAHETLNASSITEFNLSTGPENLRVGMRLPALGSELFFLPATVEPEQDVDLGDSLRNQLRGALQRLIDQLAANSADSSPRPILPDPLALELVVESDAPCRFTFSQFKLSYRLARESFQDGAPKKVLRFIGDQPQRQRLGITVPASVSPIRASLTVAADPGGEAETGSAPSPSSPLTELIAAGIDEGLRVDPAHHWLSPLTVDTPMLSRGVDLLVMALSPSSHLQLEIIRDGDGLPDGERLASAELELPSSGRRAPSRFLLDTLLQLQPGSYWMRLRSRDGAAVWNLRASPGARTLQADSNRITGKGIEDKTGIARWIPAGRAATIAPTIPEIAFSGRTLAVSRPDKVWSYDLAPALEELSGTGLVLRDLEVFSGQRGPVTLYPPRIEFEI